MNTKNAYEPPRLSVPNQILMARWMASKRQRQTCFAAVLVLRAFQPLVDSAVEVFSGWQFRGLESRCIRGRSFKRGSLPVVLDIIFSSSMSIH